MPSGFFGGFAIQSQIFYKGCPGHFRPSLYNIRGKGVLGLVTLVFGSRELSPGRIFKICIASMRFWIRQKGIGFDDEFLLLLFGIPSSNSIRTIPRECVLLI